MFQAIIDMLTGIGIALVPSMDASPEQQYRWRVRVALVSCLAFTGVCLASSSALGVVPWFEGFATKADVKKMRADTQLDVAGMQKQFDSLLTELQSNRADRISVDLLNLQVSHCKATSEEARRLWWDNIVRLRNQYYDVTKREWPLPRCEDL